MIVTYKSSRQHRTGPFLLGWALVMFYSGLPGSTLADGVVTANQLRYFSKPLKRQGIIEKVVMESFDNGVAPTTVAVTAELANPSATPQAEKTPEAQQVAARQ